MTPFIWCSRHPFSIVMAAAGLLLFGVLAFFELDREEMPGSQRSSLTVLSRLDGYAAEEIEYHITIPLENSMSGIQGIKKIESLSRRGYSKILIGFDWGADMYSSSLALRECIDEIYPYMPEGMEKPVVLGNERAAAPVLRLTVKSLEHLSIEENYALLDREIRNRLQSLDEIAFCSLQGLKRPEVQVDLDMDALSVRDISMAQTVSALSSFLVNKTAGRVTDAGLQRLVRVESGIRSPEELQELYLFPGIKLKDIGKVGIGPADEASLFLYNGKEAWGISLYKSGAAGTIEAVNAVSGLLPILNDEYAGILEFRMIDEEASRIRKTLRSLFLSLLFGLVACFTVLLLLCRQFRTPLITAAAIPYTLILSFFFLYLLGITVNAVSLYGMIASIGLIADSSIVSLHELENGKDVGSIASPLITSTTTTVIVFLPPLFVPGPLSVLFSDLVLTVIITVSLSLPVALFLTPACYRLLSGQKNALPLHRRSSSLRTAIDAGYLKILDFILGKTSAHRWISPLLMTAFLATVLLFILMPLSLFPHRKSKKTVISFHIPRELDRESILTSLSAVSGRLMDEYSPESLIIESIDDSENWADSLILTDQNRFRIIMIHETKTPYRKKQNIREFCHTGLGLKNCFLLPPPGMHRGGTYDDSHMILSAADVDRLYDMPLLRDYEEACDSFENYYEFKTETERLQASGISALGIHSELAARLEGLSAGDLERGKDKFTILVRAADRNSLQELLNHGMGSPSTPLQLLGSFSLERNREVLYRYNRRYLRILSPKEGTLSASRKPGPPLPEGITIMTEEREELDRLVYLYLLSLILLFLVIAVQTGSLRHTVLLYSFIPPAISGGLMLLLLSGSALNIYGFLGLLILQGTIVNSGILLLSSLRSGSARPRHIRQGAALRLRSISASCLSTVTALLPLLMVSLLSGNGESGMALTLMGGLLIGNFTILTLLPPLYRSLEAPHVG